MMSSIGSTTSVCLDWMVEDAVLAYLDWREASMGVWHAYAGWENAAAEDKVWAFAAYLAAIDQEEAAANAYADLIGRVTLLLAGL